MKVQFITMSAVLAVGATPASAHHSASMYDHEHQITVEAVVRKLEWVNPHSKLEVVTTPTDGSAPKVWTVEMSSPGVMTRSGWTKNSFKPGDHITLKLSPLRSGGPVGLLIAATVGGKTLSWSLKAGEKAGLK